MTIDITITATRRPEILERTLKSFTENLFFQEYSPEDFQVYINIDPVGLNVPSENVAQIAMRFFPNVKFRMAKVAHFPTAFLWCWGKTTSPYVFHLEEDWECIRPVSLVRMVDLMSEDNKLAHLRLSCWKSETRLKNWNKFLDFNGKYFEVPEDIKGTIGFCGHPSLNRGWFVRRAIEHMDPERNPEKEIKWRNKPLWEHLEDKRFGCFQGMNAAPTILEIGRRWMIENGFRKKGNKEHFVVWEKDV